MGIEERQNREGRMRVLESVRGHDSEVPHAFNHTQGCCPKCGSDRLITMFCATNQQILPRVRSCEIDGEHLHRICGSCKYPWVERCLDQAMLSEQSGELIAESEAAAILAMLADHKDRDLILPRDAVYEHRGWIVKFERDIEGNRITVTSRPPDPTGKPHHPLDALEEGGAA